ncbi:MAG: hypothetical protein ABIV06_03780 [Thermoanaerobaculia bacterium]
MSRSPAGTTREEQALAEIARTTVDPLAAMALVAVFILLLLAGGVLELRAAATGRSNLLHGKRALAFPRLAELVDLWHRQGALAAANRLRDAGVEAQDRFDRDSQLAEVLRPHLQALLTRTLRFGNSQVLVGEEGWLFFRDDFEYVTGPPFLAPESLARRGRGAPRHPSASPDPMPAILGLAADLRGRGVGFVVVPVPTKLGIAWERFLGRRERSGPALSNSSHDEFLAGLHAAEVQVFDPTPVLRAMELRGEKPYMRFDSHWSPAGLDRVAAELSAVLEKQFELGDREVFKRGERAFERRADLADLLGLDPGTNPYLIEPLQIQLVDGPGERPFNSRRGPGPVLLVGDSFSRLLIRNKRKGGDANFAAQLAFYLQRPVQMLAENDAGAEFALRASWLKRVGDLDQRKVVVFEVAERALALGDWTPERLGATQ